MDNIDSNFGTSFLLWRCTNILPAFKLLLLLYLSLISSCIHIPNVISITLMLTLS